MKQKETELLFEKLIREHELLVYKVCRIYAFTDHERQDLYQEILIQLWKGFQTFRGDSKFSTWLYRVAIHTAISGLRKKKNFIVSYEPENLPNIKGEIIHDDVKDEQLQELYKAIEQLNEVEKAIIMLYLEEKSYDEMEEILGINQGNLRVKMNRIKEKLRQLTQK